MDVTTMNDVAVITGDLVGSSEHSDSGLADSALSHLKNALRYVAIDILKGNLIDFEIYRGDSFQGIMAVEDALYSSLVLRMHIRTRSVLFSPETSTPLDVRIAVGIGTITSTHVQKTSESDGPAFRRSGPLLDSMEKTDSRLRFCAPSEEITEELNAECALLDALIARWTFEQSEAVFMHLLGQKQTEIAKKLEVSQPAIAKRLGRAGVSAVDVLLKRYEQIARNITHEGYKNN